MDPYNEVYKKYQCNADQVYYCTDKPEKNKNHFGKIQYKEKSA